MDWPEDARRDRLIGDWHFYQRRGGHRTSTDDLITAWCAAHRFGRRPARYLDLGCGIGSVLLMVSHKLRPLESVGVEAQEQSVLMAQRSIDELPENDARFSLVHSDLRQAKFETTFDLITGSPPYFPLSAGVVPNDPQRRDCRFESRGGVEVYCQAAAKWLAPEGRFYLVYPTQWSERLLRSAREQGLHCRGTAFFHTKADQSEPFLAVYEYAKDRCDSPWSVTLAVRDQGGALTANYQAIRRELGVS